VSEIAILKAKLKDTQTECDRLQKQVMELDRLRCELLNELFALRGTCDTTQKNTETKEG
jgi:hypothetical protein